MITPHFHKVQELTIKDRCVLGFLYIDILMFKEHPIMARKCMDNQVGVRMREGRRNGSREGRREGGREQGMELGKSVGRR